MSNLKKEQIEQYYNIQQLSPIDPKPLIIDAFDIKRDYDLRTANEFISQMRQQFFQEILNFKNKSSKEIADALKIKSFVDITDVYSFNQLKSINIRFVEEMVYEQLRDPGDYFVQEQDLAYINNLLDLILKCENNKMQLSFEGFFLLLMNIHGTQHLRNLENSLEKYRNAGVFLFKYYDTILPNNPQNSFQSRILRLVTLYTNIYQKSTQKTVQTRYAWQFDLRLLLHRLIYEKQKQIYEKHKSTTYINEYLLNFYDLIKYPDLLTSSFYKNIYNQQVQGYNVIIILDMIMEVLEQLVQADYNVNTNLKLEDLPISNQSFLLDPSNYE